MRILTVELAFVLAACCVTPTEASSQTHDTSHVEVLYSTGDHPFGEVRSVELLADGGLAVADAQADHVAIFDEHGELVDTIGGKGNGPGELSGLVAVNEFPDGTLATLSHGGSRITLYRQGAGPETHAVGGQYIFATLAPGPKLYGLHFETSIRPPEWWLTATEAGTQGPGESHVVVPIMPNSDRLQRPGGQYRLHPYHLGSQSHHVNRNGDYVYLDVDTAVVVGNVHSGETARLPRPDWTPIEQDMDEVQRAWEVFGTDPPSSLGKQLPVIIVSVHRDDQGRVWFGRTARIQSMIGEPLRTIVWEPGADEFTTVIFPPGTGMTEKHPFMVRDERAAVVATDEYGRQTVYVVSLPSI